MIKLNQYYTSFVVSLHFRKTGEGEEEAYPKGWKKVLISNFGRH